MAHPSPLARYIGGCLTDRGESPDDFAGRVGINSSGLYKLLRGVYAAPQQRTLEKIAGGLGMSAAELLAAADAENEPDLIKQAILQRVPEMREAVEGAPRVFWPIIIKSLFDRAIEGARDMAQLAIAAEAPVSGSDQHGVSASDTEQTRGESASDGGLALRKPLATRLALSH